MIFEFSHIPVKRTGSQYSRDIGNPRDTLLCSLENLSVSVLFMLHDEKVITFLIHKHYRTSRII